MFVAMNDLCQGAELCDSTQAYSHQHTIHGFVDNVANIFKFGLPTMLESHYSKEMVAQGMQAKAQTWEWLLWSTRGSLFLHTLLSGPGLHFNQTYTSSDSTITPFWCTKLLLRDASLVASSPTWMNVAAMAVPIPLMATCLAQMAQST
jgi:hypothetical protein